MGDAADAFDGGLEIVDELYRKALDWEKKRKQECDKRNLPRLVDFGLREPEAEAWLEGEPDFSRPIVMAPRDKLTEWYTRGGPCKDAEAQRRLRGHERTLDARTLGAIKGLLSNQLRILMPAPAPQVAVKQEILAKGDVSVPAILQHYSVKSRTAVSSIIGD